MEYSGMQQINWNCLNEYKKGFRKSDRPLNLHEIHLHKLCFMQVNFVEIQWSTAFEKSFLIKFHGGFHGLTGFCILYFTFFHLFTCTLNKSHFLKIRSCTKFAEILPIQLQCNCMHGQVFCKFRATSTNFKNTYIRAIVSSLYIPN